MIPWDIDTADAPAGDEILAKCLEFADFLIQKNRDYGNSALEPKRIFSSATAEEQLLVRIDDKISRMMTERERGGDMNFTEDTLKDLVCYLILLMVAKDRGARR